MTVSWFTSLYCSVFHLVAAVPHKIVKWKPLPIKSSLFDRLIACSLMQLTIDEKTIVKKKSPDKMLSIVLAIYILSPPSSTVNRVTFTRLTELLHHSVCFTATMFMVEEGSGLTVIVWPSTHASIHFLYCLSSLVLQVSWSLSFLSSTGIQLGLFVS